MQVSSHRQWCAALLSLLLLLSPLLVSAQLGIVPPCTGVEGEGACDFDDLVLLVNRIITFLLYDIAFPLSAGLFAWAGMLYLTAAGDAGKIGKARTIFFDVLWGLVIALGAWLIIDLVTSILTGTSWALNPFNQRQ